MTSPPEEVKIQCPKCKRIFYFWTRPSINLDLDNFDPEYIKQVTIATCPQCKTTIELNNLIIKQGVFYVKNNK